MAKRPVREIVDTNRYVVRVGDNFFVKHAPDGRPYVVYAPSAAWHGSYDEADKICAKIREADSRYSCVVTDIYGRPVDLKALADERAWQNDREAAFWGDR
jgi:hypothetical protein